MLRHTRGRIRRIDTCAGRDTHGACVSIDAITTRGSSSAVLSGIQLSYSILPKLDGGSYDLLFAVCVLETESTESNELGLGTVELSTFLSAPVSGSETSTIRKPMKSTTEYVGAVGEGPVRTEKRALICGKDYCMRVCTMHARI